jgi:hypothetical protein
MLVSWRDSLAKRLDSVAVCREEGVCEFAEFVSFRSGQIGGIALAEDG